MGQEKEKKRKVKLCFENIEKQRRFIIEAEMHLLSWSAEPTASYSIRQKTGALNILQKCYILC